MSQLECRQEAKRLHVAGLLVPWDDKVIIAGEEEWWVAGALDRQMGTAEGRQIVGLDVMHASKASPEEELPTVDPFGQLVDSERRSGGQWGDFRLDGSPGARMAWLLARDGVLSGFSVEFFSLDPPHQPAAASRTAKRAYGAIREGLIDNVTLTDRPVYRRARVTAAARQRHPQLQDESSAGGGGDARVPAEVLAHARWRQSQRRRNR